jgi:hypothetical protein
MGSFLRASSNQGAGTASVTLAGLLCAGCSSQQLYTPAVAPEAAAPIPGCTRDPLTNPLVTEWPASEKAHLQSLLGQQPVAVHYDGCELRIVDACRLPGSYSWKLSPPEHDTLEIHSKKELASKLPIGGFRLEGALERSGSLLVVMTTSGAFELTDPTVKAPDLGPCTDATHLVAKMTVGAFSLVGGGRQIAASGLDVSAVEIEARAGRSEHLLREAGIAEACATSTQSAPARQCASPIRLHLVPLAQEQPKTRLERRQRAGDVFVHIALAEGDEEPWMLADQGGNALCDLPCSRWMHPQGGYTLRRLDSQRKALEIIPVTGGFPVAPGQRALGIYRPERGLPGFSKTAFWAAGAPSLVMGGLLTLTGLIAGAVSSYSEEYGFLVVGGGFIALGGGLWWWYSWSEEGSFEVRPMPGARSADTPPSVRIGLGPGYIGGTF